MYDVIIIGNGPAGLSAALYVLRANRSVLIVGKDDGSLKNAGKIENYFGMQSRISGKELIEAGKKQVLELGAELINEEVMDIKKEEFFTINTKSKEYFSKVVIMATGTTKKTLRIKGLKDLEGKGVSYCAVCDAFFYRNKDVAVLGSGEYALHELKHIIPIAKSVSVLTNGMKIKTVFPPDICVINEHIKELQGKDKLKSVIFDNGNSIDLNGLFIAVGSATSVDLARKIGAVINKDKIVVDENMETSVPELFAAGDCTGGIQQISVAVGEGAKAGLSAIRYFAE